MAQQTAVDWFAERLTLNGLADFVTVEEEDLYNKLKQQAKEMEKQQIIKAVNVGFDEGCKLIENIKLESGEQYYTQTYGK
jgi:DNA-binding ferritin-like protein